MKTLSFILGVAAVVAIAMVAVMFRVYREVERLKSNAQEHEKWLNEIERQIGERENVVHQRIDQEIDRVNRYHDEIHRIMDSRFDKFENKITENLPNKKGY